LPTLAAVLVAGVLFTGAGVACTPAPDPLLIRSGVVRIQNQTDQEWHDVEIWLNDHYRVTAASIPPGSRFDAPLGVFVAGFGQRFDPRRQSPSGMELTATQEDGTPVRLVWGKGRRR
jgi:hypothetical protein